MKKSGLICALALAASGCDMQPSAHISFSCSVNQRSAHVESKDGQAVLTIKDGDQQFPDQSAPSTEATSMIEKAGNYCRTGHQPKIA